MPSSHYEPIFYSMCLKAEVPTFPLMQDLKQSVEKKKIKNIDFICYSEKKIYLIENKYIIEQFKILSNKQSVLIKTLIDLDTKNILGRYLYDNSGVLIASAEYFDHHQFIPKKINIIWYEENIQMTWNIKNIQKNCNLPASLFKIPLAK